MLELPICDIGSHVDPNFNTCVRVLGPRDTFPRPNCISRLYLDLETTRGNPDEESLHPHKDCKVLGVSFLFDREPIPYYIPVRHYYIDANGKKQNPNDTPNCDIHFVHDYLRYLFETATFWINHNIKYDLHVIFNELGYYPKAKPICTLNLCKLAPIEERFEYGMTGMMRLLGKDISCYEQQIKQHLGKEYKDYGLIPVFSMAPYAGVDVLCARKLHDFTEKSIDLECSRIVNLETDLLPELFKIEQIGMRPDVDKIKYDWEHINRRQTSRIQQIKKITGYTHFQPDKKDSLRELFCERLGWQMDFTDKTLEKLAKFEITEDEVEYSFDKASVLKHKNENPELVSLYLDYQKEEKLFTSFTGPYLTEHLLEDGLIHCWFNQLVRSGRTSCQRPNMQQLSVLAKEYIVPYDDSYVLVDFDLSQIEFRVICHYIGNKAAIEAFNIDPDTDFHDWVAGMCGIHRKPAKNINFMLGYGGGKEKCISMLMAIPEIIKGLSPGQIEARAFDVYNTYHKTLPELKPTQWRASDVLRSRGYVRTLLGRRRYLPRKAHFKAFNSVCQGSAADIQKDIILRLRKYGSSDCLLHAIVHDSFLFSIKKNRLKELIPEIKFEIERPIEGVDFSVPLRSGFGISGVNWRFTDEKERLKESSRFLPLLAS